nr:potassium-transporting ATPase subunit KdpA [Promineifilum sp.]
MTLLDIIQVIVFIGLLIVCTPVLGGYMKRVFDGERTFLSPVLRPVERAIYRLTGVNPEDEQTWKQYTLALLVFNVLGFLALFLMQLLQGVLPLNPERLPGVEPLLAFNTATSFMTNTNWQSYAGEVTLSQLTQMMGLGVQNFLSPATGIAVVLALTRGLVRKSAATLGNFWADMVRSVLYILLPLSMILAIVLVSQGVVQNFDA